MTLSQTIRIQDIPYGIQDKTPYEVKGTDRLRFPSIDSLRPYPFSSTNDTSVVRHELLDRKDDFVQLREIESLEENWDQYGANRICNQCIKKARRMIESLPPFVHSPDIFPNPNGTVTLEWDEDSGFFSIEIGKEKFSSFLDITGKEPQYYHEPSESGLLEFRDLAFKTLFDPLSDNFSISKPVSELLDPV